jgi:hypothetical protein
VVLVARGQESGPGTEDSQHHKEQLALIVTTSELRLGKTSVGNLTYQYDQYDDCDNPEEAMDILRILRKPWMLKPWIDTKFVEV